LEFVLERLGESKETPVEAVEPLRALLRKHSSDEEMRRVLLLILDVLGRIPGGEAAARPEVEELRRRARSDDIRRAAEDVLRGS
jgi:hypothetical protein